MMKNKEEIQQECARLGAQHFELLSKHKELVSQSIPAGWPESGEPMPTLERKPEDVIKELQESMQEVQDAFKRWVEYCTQLNEIE